MKITQAEEYVHDDNASEVITNERLSKIVLCDFDDLVHFTLYSGKDEFGEKNPEYTEDDLDYLKSKLSELVFKTLNSVERYFDIKNCYIFIKGKNNFRKDLYPSYKSHRSEPNPLSHKLYEHLIQEHQAIESNGAEADDLIFTFSKKINHTGIIVSNDKDLKQISGIFYNHKKDFWNLVTEKEAKYNTYKLLVCGDSADNIPGAKGCGIKYFEKNFNINMTDEEYEDNLFKAYLKASNQNEEQAKIDMELNKKLVLLKDMDNENYENIVGENEEI